jgi:hypothetical protein
MRVTLKACHEFAELRLTGVLRVIRPVGERLRNGFAFVDVQRFYPSGCHGAPPHFRFYLRTEKRGRFKNVRAVCLFVLQSYIKSAHI